MKEFEWCGFKWKSEMAGGRKIDPRRPYEWYSENSVCVGMLGNLTLGIYTEPKKISYGGKTYNPKYGVGLIRSSEKFTYGNFSAEIMLPKGAHLWPSFWLVGDTEWPACGEIDIMEAWSDIDGSYFKPILPRWNTTSNIHYSKDEKHVQEGKKCVSWFIQPENPSCNFIRYECDWAPDKIVFKVDGRTVRKITGKAVDALKDKELNVVFNLWTDNENFNIDSQMIIRNFKYSRHKY